MLDLGLARKLVRIGGEKREGTMRVFLVFRKVKGYSSDEVPEWMNLLQIGYGALSVRGSLTTNETGT